MEVKGIDVSYAQGVIDWKKVKASGIGFAIIRACFGWDNDKQIDRYFKQNVAGAQAAGVPFGLYHYSYATTPEEAVKEAKFFLRVIAGLKPTYPVVFDLEDPSQQKLGKANLTAIAKAFLSTVQEAGYYAMLYTNLDWIRNRLDMSQLSSYDIWLAQWSSKPSYTGHFGMWQYTSSGSVSGIGTRVDMDIAYQDYSGIIKGAGLNGWKAEEEPPIVGPTVDEKYEILSKEYDKLAEKYERLKKELGGVLERYL
ncbi:glycoside hydrolase family 25 protein [Zongyangia hominis]|uniref:Lysozyme n=1 Tax=Zongyangia hominis TaxID=2763677 RepID=A0A926ICB9_9FIRM|nr:glycoside hydrolase family 25 protein [Zongyangia hominis]MBC8571052.1 hypothetical protein [Zongyangia hominis]